MTSVAGEADPDLLALQKSLLDLSEAIRRKQSKAQTQEELDALLREIQEVFHRSVIVGGLIFHSVTEALSRRISNASAVVDKTKNALHSIETIKEVVEVVTQALVVVDKVIDLLKKVPL